MRNLRRLTRQQKIRLSKLGLDATEYLLYSETADALTVVHRTTGKITTLAKKPRS